MKPTKKKFDILGDGVDYLNNFIAMDTNPLRFDDEALARKAAKVRQYQTTQESYMEGVGRRAMQVIEPAVAMATGAIAEPISGLASLPALIYGDGVSDAVKAQQSIQEWMTYTPKTQAGIDGMKSVSDLLKPVADGMEWTSRGAGDFIYEQTGSEELAAIAYSMPTAALELLGLKGVRQAGKAGKLGKQYEMGDIGTTNKQAGAVGKFKGNSPKGNMTFEDLPIADLSDPKYRGSTVGMTFADLTKTGDHYKGYDSSATNTTDLNGGPLHPLIPENLETNSVWSANSKGATTKLKKHDYVVTGSMLPTAHNSNGTVGKAMLDTTDAYLRDGRITQDNLIKLNALAKKQPSLGNLPDMRDISAVHDWMGKDGAGTFDQRRELSQLLAGKAAQKLGVPNIQKILDNTIEEKYAGYGLGNAMTLMKIDRTPDAQFKTGGDSGTKEDYSYGHGIKGEIVARFPVGTTKEDIFPTYLAGRRADGKVPKDDIRAITWGNPSQLIDDDFATNYSTPQFKHIQSPRQAQVADDFINRRWKSSFDSVKNGGLSQTGFIDAINRNGSSATLGQYDPKKLKADIKSGSMELYQLNDKEMYFGIKNGYNYNDEYGIDLAAAGLSPNEKAIVGVVSNEIGAPGMAATPMMLKAIQEGATVLDAFSVKSDKFPKGFLPTIYSKYGFKEVATSDFKPEFILNEGLDEKGLSSSQRASIKRKNELRLEDMKHDWRKNSWDESQGWPQVSVMKYIGDPNGRADFQQQYLNAIESGDESSFVGRTTEQSLGSTREAIRESRRATGGRVSGQGNASNDTGSIRNSNGTPLAGRFADPVNMNALLSGSFPNIVKEVNDLTPDGRIRLGLQ